jgi:hypothetical protein
VVEDRQRQRLEQDGLGERPGDREDGRAGEPQLALDVAVDVAGEAVVGQPVQSLGVDDPLLAQERDLVRAEPEVLERVEEPAGARDDAVAPAVGQPAREQLEDRRAVGRAGAQRRLQHGQLVVVGQQCR